MPPLSLRPPRVRGFAMTRAKTPQEKIAKLREENKKLRSDLQAKTKELNKQKNLMKMAAKSLGKTAGYFAVAAGLEPDGGRATARPAAVEPAALGVAYAERLAFAEAGVRGADSGEAANEEEAEAAAAAKASGEAAAGSSPLTPEPAPSTPPTPTQSDFGF